MQGRTVVCAALVLIGCGGSDATPDSAPPVDARVDAPVIDAPPPECTQPSDCTATGECVTADCVEGVCQATPAPAGVACAIPGTVCQDPAGPAAGTCGCVDDLSQIGTGDFTIALDLEPAAGDTGTRTVIGQRASCNDSDFWDLRWIDGHVLFELYEDATHHLDLTSTATVATEERRRVVVVRMGDQVDVLLDTQPDVGATGTVSLGETPALHVASGDPCEGTGASMPLLGTVQHVCVRPLGQVAAPVVEMQDRGLAPAITGWGAACIAGADDTTLTDCATLRFGGYTYWVLSDVNNDTHINLVAVDAAGTITWQRVYTTLRYHWQTTVDADARTVTFYGQGPDSITLTWAQLVAMQ